MENNNQENVEHLKYFLVACGIEILNHFVLVRAISFEEACEKIKEKRPDMKVFSDATIQ
jgi:hypothetical protein